MFLLVEHGTLYDPTPRGQTTLLIANDRVERIGRVEGRHLGALGLEYDKLHVSSDADFATPDMFVQQIWPPP